MKVKLSDAQHSDRKIVLDKSLVVLGRGPDADIQVVNLFASRRHCEISEKDGSLFVRDLGSRLGTFVNGREVEEVVLNSGDMLSVGATTFVVYCESSDECQNAVPSLVNENRP